MCTVFCEAYVYLWRAWYAYHVFDCYRAAALRAQLKRQSSDISHSSSTGNNSRNTSAAAVATSHQVTRPQPLAFSENEAHVTAVGRAKWHVMEARRLQEVPIHAYTIVYCCCLLTVYALSAQQRISISYV
jgi:hypothetical protein